MQRAALLLSLSLLGACASAPVALRGEFADLTPKQGLGSDAAIRWGGRVIEVLNSKEQGCLEILGAPLDTRARPLPGDHDSGRFRACQTGFLDPAVFAAGRDVTVTGHVSGEDTRQLGDFVYHMPRVAIDELLLWPEREAPQVIFLQNDPFFWHQPWWPRVRLISLPPRAHPVRQP
jgi:outer membrane lipoprotein